MSLDRPWLQSYPKGVPAEIDVNEFHSVVSVFDASVAKYRDRPAYSSFGKTLTYGETDDFCYNVTRDPVHVHDLNATILNQLGLDHTRLTHRSQGRDFRLTDVHGEVVRKLLA
jgi:hypothetical protein